VPIFHNTGTGWRRVERWTYASEEELETFLIENPDIIAAERGDAWTVWTRQLVPIAGNQLDLLGVGSDGSITIVECKLGSNREERREVVAQVLEYASALWKMPLAQFRETFRKHHSLRRDPFDLLTEQARDGAAETGWDIEEAKRIAELNLKEGRFRLVVAVDDISERLKDIVDYVNERGRGELKIVAMALPRYGEVGSSVLAPEVYGERALAPTNRSAQQLNPTFDQLLSMGPPELHPLLQEVHRFLGTGMASTGRLTPRPNKTSISYDGRVSGGRTFNVLQLWPSTGSKRDAAPSCVLAIIAIAMEALGTTSERVTSAAAARGFDIHRSGIRLRAPDLPRLPELFEVIDSEVLSRIDA